MNPKKEAQDFFDLRFLGFSVFSGLLEFMVTLSCPIGKTESQQYQCP